jgi:hypothetical protein
VIGQVVLKLLSKRLAVAMMNKTVRESTGGVGEDRISSLSGRISVSHKR